MLDFTFFISHQSLFTFACVQIRHNPLSGGYCGGVPPLPIPNREVKPTCADGTAMQCGRVGRRLLSMKSLRFRKISEAFLFSSRGSFSSPLVFSSRWILVCHADFADDADFFSLIILVSQISQIYADFFHWLFFSWIYTDFLWFSSFPVISSFFLLFLYFADFRPVGLGRMTQISALMNSKRIMQIFLILFSSYFGFIDFYILSIY